MNASIAGFRIQAVCLFVVAGVHFTAAAEPQATNDLFSSSLASLMQIQVTIAQGTPEQLSGTAAAVSVITQEDIQRSGVTTIPDALRLVPGLDVARLDAHTWAVSSRGFNDDFANKLLVMIDGRTVYTPLFSGVFWDVQNTLMEDIDRIEVVRGPGATIWGANAVNGVINIITKSAADTQGVLVSGGAGSQEGEFGSVRFGTAVDDGVFLKGYAKYFDHDASNLPQGSPADDAWSMFQGGFRMDVDKTNQNLFTLQGDAYTGDEHEIYMVAPAPIASVDTVAGANVLGRWTHNFSDDSALNVRMYYDRTLRDAPIFGETQDTYDLDAQHNFQLGQRQEITWGGEFRYVAGDIRGSPYISFTDPDRSLELFSAFVQDDISLAETNLQLTLGSKFEHNDFTGFEVQPSARLAWTPGARQTVWGSVSRAVRTPSESESDIMLKTTPGLTIVGNPNMLSEELVAYELGYRIQPAQQWNLDVTGYYNHYDRLRSESLVLTPSGPDVAIDNGLEGRSYGGETSATFQATPSWRLSGGYTYCQVNIQGTDIADTEELLEGSSPRSQFFARSSLDLPDHVTLDGTLRYVDSLNFPASTMAEYTHIPSYVTYDLRLAWSPWKAVEFSIVGQNLGQAQHLEFAPTYIPTEQTAVVRSVYGKVTIRF
jgi:iron complex outermembrane receptor protein